MAEKKVSEAMHQYDPEEVVTYTAPILYSDRDRDIVVGVNGELIRIKRGVPVEIKRKFLEVILASERQKNAAWQAMEQARTASAKALTNL